ncbi:50S ribosomal protein L18 [Candidatus Woesearchaeota archaeon]|nr:50S ribosomal protein L18 [Candidatus Woesearchaeota archaeon]
MASKTTYTVQYRRKRNGKTNYKRRLELLKGRQKRLIVRRTNTQIIMQIATYNPDGDKILLTTGSADLKKTGWKHDTKTLPAAYLTGLILAKEAQKHQITEAILDLGLQTPKKGNRIYSALKGAIDGGLKIPASKEIFPSEDRITGKHIAQHNEKAKSIQEDFEKTKKQILN